MCCFVAASCIRSFLSELRIRLFTCTVKKADNDDAAERCSDLASRGKDLMDGAPRSGAVSLPERRDPRRSISSEPRYISTTSGTSNVIRNSSSTPRALFLFSSLPPVSATMLSGILIFNQKGENLIFRSFRSDCRPRLADIFRIQVISNAQVRSPILTLGSTTFSHVKHENIYLVAVTKSNANAALVFEFLYRLIMLGKGYFGKFDEEAVKNNFVLVYELLDGRPSLLVSLCTHAAFSPPSV